MKSIIFSMFKYNKFVFGNQVVSQFVIFEHKRLFSIIIFYFHKSSGTQDRFHTHAFNAWSFKLFGQYTEYSLNDIDAAIQIKRRVNIIEYFPRNCFHKIGNSNGCATILFSGRWKDGWKERLDTGDIIEYNWGRERTNIINDEHEVIVYDENNNELERCMQPINVKHLTRYKHTFGDYTTYSFNTHYTNGLVFYGMIPDPPFPLNIKKDKI